MLGCNSFATCVPLLFHILFSACLGVGPSSKVAGSARHILKKIAVTYNKPEQVHLSFGSLPTSVVIMWSLNSNEKSFVEYGDKPNAILRIPAESTYLKEHSELAKRFLYHVQIKDLIPGKHYTYRIITGVSEIKSSIFSFDIPHNDTEKPHSYMIVADMGLLTKSLQFVVHEALSNRYEAIFHVGDIAYNLDTQKGSHGDLFMNKIQKFASKVPYMTIPGDHEKFHDFYHYRYRFSSPGSHWPMKEEELWYSIDIGHAHFISINTQAIYLGEKFQKQQLHWLQKDLSTANENRKLFPWIIVFGHKPLYCTKTIREQECDKEVSKIREVLEDMFYEYGVDLYISGHKHCYERSYPVYKSHASQMNTTNPKAPIYIIIGAMGYEYLFHEQKSVPKWLAAAATERDKELFARLTINNSTHLTWSAHVATNNKKVDEMQLVQVKHGSFRRPRAESDKSQWNAHPLHGRTLDAGINSGTIPTQFLFYDQGNRAIMLCVGVFSFSFLLFLFIRYTRMKTFCR